MGDFLKVSRPSDIMKQCRDNIMLGLSHDGGPSADKILEEVLQDQEEESHKINRDDPERRQSLARTTVLQQKCLWMAMMRTMRMMKLTRYRWI